MHTKQKHKNYAIFASVLCIVCLLIALPNTIYAESDTHSSSGQAGDVEESKYFDLVPLFLSVVSDKGVSSHISLLISIEIEKGEVEQLEHYRAKLANAYIQDLYGVLGSDKTMMNGSIVDVEQVRHRLIRLTRRTLGEEYTVKDILLQVVHQGDF